MAGWGLCAEKGCASCSGCGEVNGRTCQALITNLKVIWKTYKRYSTCLLKSWNKLLPPVVIPPIIWCRCGREQHHCFLTLGWAELKKKKHGKKTAKTKERWFWNADFHLALSHKEKWKTGQGRCHTAQWTSVFLSLEFVAHTCLLDSGLNLFMCDVFVFICIFGYLKE